MPRCAVIDCVTGEQVNLIVADPSDPPPDGFFLVEICEGHYWNGAAVVPDKIADPNLIPDIVGTTGAICLMSAASEVLPLSLDSNNGD